MSSTLQSKQQERRFWRGPDKGEPIRLTPKSRARNRSTAVVGVVLLVIAGLTNVALYTNAGKRVRVLAVKRAVSAGAQIAQDDLAAVQVAVDPKLQPIPAGEFQSVVGQTARVGLLPQTLLSRGQLTTNPALPAGSAVVGVLIKPGQAPSVQVGDRVVVVAAPPSGAAEQNAATKAFPGAQVFAVDTSSGSGDILVSLLADYATAGQIAVAAADRPISLILLPASSR